MFALPFEITGAVSGRGSCAGATPCEVSGCLLASGRVLGSEHHRQICVRLSSGSCVNLRPPPFLESSVHTRSTVAATRFEWPEDESRIVIGIEDEPSSGATAKKPSPPSETSLTIPPLPEGSSI